MACGFQGPAYSDELKIFTSRAVATILEKIGPEYEKTGLVRSVNGVAVRTGAPKPDISSLENFKRALLDAK